MLLKFKLTDTATGADWTNTDCVIDTDGSVLFVVGGDTIHRDEDISNIIPRLFTGLHDAADNEIYEGDILQSLDPAFQPKVVIFEVGSFMLAYAGKPTYFGSRLSDENLSMKIIGNRWQPEFKVVFRDDV